MSLERANLLSIINILGVQTSITNTSIKLSNKIDFLVFSWLSTMMRSRMTVLWQLEEMKRSPLVHSLLLEIDGPVSSLLNGLSMSDSREEKVIFQRV